MKRTILFLTFALAGIAITGYTYFWILTSYVAPDLGFNPSAWSNTGVFGDTFGGFTAFFSALAFAGVIYSLYEQDQHTRTDRFEAKFFQMLQAQRDIVAEMDLKRKVKSKKPGVVVRKVTTTGRECFKVIYNQHFVKYIFKAYEKTHGKLDASIKLKKNTYKLCSLKQLVTIYEENLFPWFQNDLSHYFRHLYHIVRMIDSASYLKDKSEYIGILRAQMSMYELLLLFYNGLSSKGNEKFLPLIERHGLLKSINEDYLMNGSSDIDPRLNEGFGYKPGAFESKTKSRVKKTHPTKLVKGQQTTKNHE
jgi:Putative phage abortive infection protein